MAIIQTGRNQVIAGEPQADDIFVRASFLVPADGQDIFNPRILTPRHLRYEPINNYPALVDWAVGIADQMAYPIHVQPLSYDDFVHTNRSAPFRAYIQGLDHQAWGKLRQELVASMAGVMRDCNEPEVRATAYEALVMLKVIH